MRIAHFSDTHLGRTQFTRTTSDGINQRESDLMQSFCRTLKAMEAQEPDLVIHAGDFFDKVRPGNWSVIRAFREVARFQEARKGRPFLIIAGNHDTPQTADAEHILRLFEEIKGVKVAIRGVKSFEYPDLDLYVTLAPSDFVRRGDRTQLSPATSLKTKVLALHGLATGIKKDAGEFDPATTYPDRWDYVALGDYHVAQDLGTNIRYCGSTDFASTNLWEEVGTPKSWTLFDTDTRTYETFEIKVRPVIDLKPIDAAEMNAADLNAALQANFVVDENQLPVVRQLVHNVHTDLRRTLDMAIVREFQQRCLHYHFVPLSQRAEGESAAQVAARTASLEELWTDHIENADIPRSLERAEVVRVGQDLLREAAEHEADQSAA
jgi:DNA repair exonuclease SbcCD nuclease subunit